MTVLDPGHVYSLKLLDGDGEQLLTFVKREGPRYPGNVGSHPGTTSQEILTKSTCPVCGHIGCHQSCR